MCAAAAASLCRNNSTVLRAVSFNRMEANRRYFIKEIDNSNNETNKKKSFRSVFVADISFFFASLRIFRVRLFIIVSFRWYHFSSRCVRLCLLMCCVFHNCRYELLYARTRAHSLDYSTAHLWRISCTKRSPRSSSSHTKSHAQNKKLLENMHRFYTHCRHSFTKRIVYFSLRLFTSFSWPKRSRVVHAV